MLRIEKLTSNYVSRSKLTVGIESFSYIFQEANIYALVGSNGSGKTTLLKSLLGLKRFQEGQVFFNEELLDYRRNVFMKNHAAAVLAEVSNLYPELTILENIKYFFCLNKKSYRKYRTTVAQWLSALDLESHLGKSIFECSYGTKRKAELLLAILKEAKILILDEPFLGLDLTTSDGIKQSLKDLSKQAIVIITSHDLKALNDIATQTLYIQDGSIVDHHNVLQLKTFTVNFIRKTRFNMRLLYAEWIKVKREV